MNNNQIFSPRCSFFAGIKTRTYFHPDFEHSYIIIRDYHLMHSFNLTKLL